MQHKINNNHTVIIDNENVKLKIIQLSCCINQYQL